jgi:hypothetical protein
MTLLGRDVVEIDALVTDRYLDSLLAAGDPWPLGSQPGLREAGRSIWRVFNRAGRADSDRLDDGVRLASDRLTRDLPRFHPSFRFEERLAARLADAAAAMRLPMAAGGEEASQPVPIRDGGLGLGFDPLGRDPGDDDPTILARPLLVGGAVAASALSLAGAAWVVWRRSRPSSSPMARAARAAHAMRGRPA